MASNAPGKSDSFRRTWDKEEYGKKARERLEELDDDEEEESTSKRKEPPVKRKLLQKREFDVDLESNLGKSVVITKSSTMSQSGGYYCNVCDCIVKDSINFLDHINGKKHQRNLGMSMKVERSSLDQVKKRFEFNKRKREEEGKQKADYDLDERIATLKEEEEQRKQQRKDFRKEKKLKSQGEDDVDPDMAAMMGFSGFGSTKN